MRVKHHAAISLGTAALVYFGSRSVPAALLSGLAGTLLDIDHLPTFVRRGIHRSSRNENPIVTLWKLATLDNRELSHRYGIKLPETYTPGHFLHQIEIAVALPVLLLLMGHPYAALGLAAGIASHLAADIFFNRPPTRSMSLIARLLPGDKAKRSKVRKSL